MLQEYLEQIVRLDNLTKEELGKDLNSVVLGRISAYNSILEFLNLVDLLGRANQKEEDSFE
jgi:hypothetical protein